MIDSLNAPLLFDSIERQKNNFIKLQHQKLSKQNVFSSIFPTHFKKIVASSNDINSEYNKQIYFYNVNVVHQYDLPQECTIFIVAELFDEHGLISSFETANQYKMLFNLCLVHYHFTDESDFYHRRIEYRTKYSFIIKIEKKKIIDLIISNDQNKIKAFKTEYKFDFVKIMVGNGKGILYDLIVYNWILKKEEIDKIVLFLNKVHKFL